MGSDSCADELVASSEPRGPTELSVGVRIRRDSDALLPRLPLQSEWPPESGEEWRIAERYTVRRLIDRWPGGALYLAHDDQLDRQLVLKASSKAGDATSAELQRQELLLARSLSHPSICRVFDLLDFAGQRYLAMDSFDGTLRQWMGERRPSAVTTAFRDVLTILNDIADGLATIHDRGLVHGALNPSNVVIKDNRARLLFGPATERERAISGAPLDEVARLDPRYFSQDRLAFGHTGRGDDAFALGTIAWELISGVAPVAGVNPIDTPMTADELRASIALSLRDLFPVYRHLAGLHHVKRTRLGDDEPPIHLVPIDAGGPTGAALTYEPGSHGLIITFAPTAPWLVGTLYALESPEVEVGRHGRDIALPERTLSSRHATLRYRRGAWLVEDCGSSNGTFFDQSAKRRDRGVLRHGDEIQLGELRAKLVSFKANGTLHWRARSALKHRDGLTEMLVGATFLERAETLFRFAEWSRVRLEVVRLELHPCSSGTAPSIMIGARRCVRFWLSELGRAWPGLAVTGMRRAQRLKPGEPVRFNTVLCGRGDDVGAVVKKLVGEANQLVPGVCTIAAETLAQTGGGSIASLLEC